RCLRGCTDERASDAEEGGAPGARRSRATWRPEGSRASGAKMRRIAFIAVLAAASAARAQDAATQQLLQEADKYYDAADYERAASNFDRAIASQPKDVPPAAYAKRASIFLLQKQYDDGLKWIETVAERSWPGDDAVLEQKAVVLSRMPQHKKEAIALAE